MDKGYGYPHMKQMKRLGDRTVPPPHHDDFLFLEQGTVASAAVAYTPSGKTGFTRYFQLPVIGSCRQQHGSGQKPSPGRHHRYRVSRLNLDDLFSLKDLCILQSMADHDVHEHLAADLGKPRIVFNDRRGRHLTAQSTAFDDGCFQSAPNGIYTGSQSRWAGTHNNQVGFNQFCVDVRDKDGLRFQFLEREHKKLLGLGPLADEHIFGKGLGNAVCGILFGQIRAALNVDELNSHPIRHFNGRFDRIDSLLGTIRACGAHKHLDVSGGIDFFQYFDRGFTQLALTEPDKNQGFQKCAPFLSHGRSDPPDVKTIRGDQQGG